MYVELLIFLFGVLISSKQAVELYMTDPSCTFGPKLIEVQVRKLVFYSVCVWVSERAQACWWMCEKCWYNQSTSWVRTWRRMKCFHNANIRSNKSKYRRHMLVIHKKSTIIWLQFFSQKSKPFEKRLCIFFLLSLPFNSFVPFPTCFHNECQKFHGMRDLPSNILETILYRWNNRFSYSIVILNKSSSIKIVVLMSWGRNT